MLQPSLTRRVPLRQLVPALKGRAKLIRRYAATRQEAFEPFNAQTVVANAVTA